MNPRVLLLPTLLLGAYAPSQAQTLHYGLKGGLLASTYRGQQATPDNSIKGRLGPTAGAWLRRPLRRRVALQTELLYEARGARSQSVGPLGWEGSMGSYQHEETSRLHYLTLPVLARVQVGRFFAEAGPQVSYLVAARNELLTREYRFNPGGGVPTYSATERAEDFNRWEVGYAAGLGAELTSALSVGVRYTAAFTAVYPDDRPVSEDQLRNPAYYGHYFLGKARNAGLQLQASYRLNARE